MAERIAAHSLRPGAAGERWSVWVFHGKDENRDAYLKRALREWQGLDSVAQITAPLVVKKAVPGLDGIRSWGARGAEAVFAVLRQHLAADACPRKLLWGHSRGAQLLSRWVAQVPEALRDAGVERVGICNAGHYCMPCVPWRTDVPWPYAPRNVDEGEFRRRLCASRLQIFVVVGENDTEVPPPSFWEDADQVHLQGQHRLERAERYAAALTAFAPEQVHLLRIPSVGHRHGGMMRATTHLVAS